MARLRILFYGINGTGLGHLSRLLRIAREARELVNSMNIQADFRFITTSEASQAAWDFPVYKLPSKTVVASSGTPNHEFLGNSQFFISNLAAAFRPDILVMDTVPEGSFGEFLSLRSFCRRTVFINRHKKEEIALNEIHQKYLPLYDLILTPDYPKFANRHHLPPVLKSEAVYTDPIHGFKPERAFGRETVRKKFGLDSRSKLVYISAGGGGDKLAQENLETIIDAVNSLGHKPLVGYGPLFQGEICYDGSVIPFCGTDVSRYFKGVDFAISAGGYNTYQELLAAEVPAIFYAQEKGMDFQEERILEGQKQGWNLYLEELNEATLAAQIQEMTQDETLQKVRDNLSRRSQAWGACNAAEELLKLHHSIPGSPIDYEQLPLLTSIRKEWSIFAVRNGIDPNSSEIAFRNIAANLNLCYALLPLRQKQLAYEGLIENCSTVCERAAQWLETGWLLSQWQQKTGWSMGKMRAVLKRFFAENPVRGGTVTPLKMMDCLQEEQAKVILTQQN
ncbi:MAG: hypothetical protein MI784_00030 [Cytophagales bacterium]|nr:hypothetical protein [Cytophagales bacterium]